MSKFKQIWVDPDFAVALEQIKAKKILNGHKEDSIAKITRDILHNEKFKEIEEDLIDEPSEFIRYDR